MDAPVHYVPNCLIDDCPKCEAEAIKFANNPTEMTEVMECGCTAITKFDGLWTITMKGLNCTETIHVV